MRDKESERLIIMAVCVCFLTLAVNILLVHFMVYAESLESMTGGMVRAVDSTGHEVGFDAGYHAYNAGPIRFIFDQSRLSGEEMYLYEDGSTLNPVEEGEYVLLPDSGVREISFYRKTADGEAVRLHGGELKADLTEGIYEKPEVKISRENGEYVITVLPLRYTNVYCGIQGRKNGRIEEIKERTEFRLSEEGVYTVSVYAEDGMGHRVYADTPDEIMIDKTPPVLDEVSIPSGMSSRRLIIPLTARDSLSGTEGIYVQTGEDEACRADSLIIEPPFRGSVYYWARDNAGNLTERKCIGEDIVVDDTAPVITAETVDINDKSLSLIVNAADDTAGVRSVRISSGKRILYSGAGAKDKVTIDLTGMEYGSRAYEIEAYDNAGNRSQSSFTIEKQDGIPPELNIMGASDKGVYGRDIRLYLDAEDDADSECKLKETVMRYSLSGELEEIDEYEEDSMLFDKSGIYIIRAAASDRAGNTSERSIAFAIDKDAPVIRGLSGLQGSVLKSFMMQPDEGIAEDDSLVRVKVMLNGMDYDGSGITKSGRYRLQVLATDEFGNTASEDVGFEVASS
ncbi:MAG: hypothetical protein J5966_11330 [Lachnospiraceae bacterium]|nr:hypothetical protein [Lachnospiraceae bacterium]